MKKSILTLLALFFAVATASAELKIVTINMQQAFDSFYKKVDVSDRMNSVAENFSNQVRDRQTKLLADRKVIEDKLQEIRDNPGLSDEAKQAQAQLLDPQIQAFQKAQQEFEAWGQEEQKKIQSQAQTQRRLLIDEIKRVATDVGVKEGADLILDVADHLNSGVPTVVYATTSIDITNKVIQEINRDAPTQ